MLTFDFGNGPVPAHRHINSNGELGGWVANSAFVAPTVYIGANAQVYDCANVLDSASVLDFAKVYNSAVVYDNVLILGSTQVFEGAVVSGNARIYGDSKIFGNAMIFGKPYISEASIYENSVVFDDAMILGNIFVLGHSYICGRAIISCRHNPTDGKIQIQDLILSHNALIEKQEDLIVVDDSHLLAYRSSDGAIYLSKAYESHTIGHWIEHLESIKRFWSVINPIDLTLEQIKIIEQTLRRK